jgi:hypothetical protein
MRLLLACLLYSFFIPLAVIAPCLRLLFGNLFLLVLDFTAFVELNLAFFYTFLTLDLTFAIHRKNS